ncbi:probable secreted protein-putative xanthan lyase related [Pedobacter sp. BAL39]|uniref:FAD-dependent oxidoreductase n=1 Tax=Pedobacter sp. BAL39 TaxID=391596 RepID=UPI0001559AA5|nr:FAD-dependent oxidoreductase [Pedobacter sp. BAL39]EDM37767.1 probable secreted protein-putative xanthan lyase related [Pedobacter sp. BAL39]
MIRIGTLLTFLLLTLFWQGSPANTGQKNYTADIIIYGGTPAAITAAVQASKMGKKVIVVSPDLHLGGMSSSGLGFTDTGNKSVIGGLAREFYHRVYLHYSRDSAWVWQKRSEYGNKGQGTPAIDGADRTMWIFEPHVAERIMEDFVRENKLVVYRNEWLDRKNGLIMKDGNIKSMSTLSGKKFSAKVFIDATYEGDLMAAAKVSYHIGREANSQYGEQWNGVQKGVFQHDHHFKAAVDPYRIAGDKSSGLLAGISGDLPPENGTADAKLQAYCYRMCLTDKPDNRIAFSKPDNYQPEHYELLTRVFRQGWRDLFNKYDAIPNRKTDVNNHGPFSTDFIGMNYDYPEASYERRREIVKAHEDYQKGLMYFMANDASVPSDLQKKLQQWGLSKDEFRDNEGWPYQLYIREARRMVGGYVVTESDVLGKKTVPHPVGMGSYALDSHNVQRYVTAEGYVQNEGDIGVKAPRPYGISYEALVPGKEECKNLLVPVCLSASHIAYGSVRMEPVFMILGESAATAASLAIDGRIPVHEVKYELLKELLLKQKQQLTLLNE